MLLFINAITVFVKLIESPANPHLKELFRLRERRIREKRKLYLLEGVRELERAIAAKANIDEILFCNEFLNSDSELFIRDLIAQNNLSFVGLSKQAFKKLSMRQNPDGIITVLNIDDISLSSLSFDNDAFVVVLDSLEKPGNVGAILRTADGAGVNAVFVCGTGTDIYNPNVLRSSLGSFYSLPIISTNNADLIRYLKEKDFKIITTSPAARDNFWQQDYKGKIAIVFGSEDKGLSQDWLSVSKNTVSIPMLGLADSLNVSVSAALLIYEALRQRSAG